MKNDKGRIYKNLRILWVPVVRSWLVSYIDKQPLWSSDRERAGIFHMSDYIKMPHTLGDINFEVHEDEV